MIKLFTHDDLDGVGCAILAKLAFMDPDIEYCNYDDINERVKDCNLHDYEQVYITDISVNKEVAGLIEDAHKGKVTLLDHHKTAEWLNKHDWATVKVKLDEDKKNCGTKLFFDYLIEYKSLDCSLRRFAEIVRRYDTWEWAENPGDVPKQWNDLLKILGRDRFIDRAIDKIKKSNINFDKTESLLLRLEQENIDDYIDKKEEYLIEKEILGYQVGIVFADRYISELGNRLHERNQHLDAIAMINPDYAVSYRTIKDDVDVSEIAEYFGGGGHTKAAGNPIDGEVNQEYIDKLFSESA